MPTLSVEEGGAGASASTSEEQKKNETEEVREQTSARKGSCTPDHQEQQQRQLQQENESLMSRMLRMMGLNFSANTCEELHEVINFLIFARISQVLFSLIAFATAGSALSKVRDFNDALGQDVLNGSGAAWALVIGLFAFIFVIVNGVMAFFALGTNVSQKLVRRFSNTTMPVDVVFLFLCTSAFSSAATFSTIIRSAANNSDGIEGTSGASAAFLFFLLLSFFYTAALGHIIRREGYLLGPVPNVHQTEAEPEAPPMAEQVSNV